MKFEVVRTKEEVEQLEDRLISGNNHGSKYPGMTYEDGALSMLEFLTGTAEATEIYEED